MNNFPEKTADSQPPPIEKLDTLLDILVELTTTDPQELSDNSDRKILDRSEEEQLHDSQIKNDRESCLYNLYKLVNNLRERQLQSEKKINDSLDTINNLIPLIEELINIRSEDKQQLIIKTIAPVIDEIIEKKAAQDSQKMGSVIAPILPEAIAREIAISPGEIAKSLAPEIANSIEEQIKIDRDSISRTIGPEMGKAIKTQIELEKDSMVDALYPVIGSTISKYMTEVINSINDRVETALSFEGFKRKIQAKIRGVSEAELILTEAVNFEVKAVFLIDKISGLVIEEAQIQSEPKLESEMLGGMLTAIRSFVNDCIENSELNQIEYGNSKIILEVAGYCYLAVIIVGEPSQKFIKEIRNIFGKIVVRYGKIIKNFDGDRAIIPREVRDELENLIKTTRNKKVAKFPATILVIFIALIGAVASPLVYLYWRNTMINQIESNAEIALDSAPELSIYRLIPRVEGDKLIISGKVPAITLRQQAIKILQNIAIEENLSLENQIIVVRLPPDLEVTAREVQTISSIFNFQKGWKIESDFDKQTQTVTLKGKVYNEDSISQIISAYKQIPGVNIVVSSLQVNLPTIKTRIYFNLGSAEIVARDFDTKIKQIKNFLDRHPELHLRIIGHGDRQGKISDNEELAIKRAIATGNALKNVGINPTRLQISASSRLATDSSQNQSLWLNRYVSFETFVPATIIE